FNDLDTNILNDLDINVLNEEEEQNAFVVTYDTPTISTDTDNQFNSSITFEEPINWIQLIKSRMERDSSGEIIRQCFLCKNSGEHQLKKKIDATHSKDKLSKKIGCPWQLNAGYRKSENAIIINKLVEKHNHSLAPHRKEFALSLRSISQEVLDTIKFLTQECNLGVKAQHRYLAKKFSDQPLYDRNLYNAIRRYGNQMGNTYNNFLQSWFRYHNSHSVAELKQNWKELLDQYPTGQSYLQQLWRVRESWAKIYVFTTFCAGMQSSQWVESMNNIIKSEDEIEKYLISESAFAQNTQISQSVLYRASLVETSNNLVSPPKAYEYSEGYLEDEYDALQASLETIIEMVNHENILEIWRVSLFD
ncbi:12513_t:CDS:2, partial [Gigaspora rosea]